MTCETGKICYTRSDAMVALGGLKRRWNNRKKKTCKVYKCDVCKNWHLTSKVNFKPRK